MNEYKIIGVTKPNKVQLQSITAGSVTELPQKKARRLLESGSIHVTNPEQLYHQL